MIVNYLRKIFKQLNKLSNGKLYLILRFLVRILLVPLTYLIWIVEPLRKLDS